MFPQARDFSRGLLTIYTASLNAEQFALFGSQFIENLLPALFPRFLLGADDEGIGEVAIPHKNGTVFQHIPHRVQTLFFRHVVHAGCAVNGNVDFNLIRGHIIGGGVYGSEIKSVIVAPVGERQRDGIDISLKDTTVGDGATLAVTLRGDMPESVGFVVRFVEFNHCKSGQGDPRL